MIAFFITIFGSLSFVHRLYAEKQRASRRVREQAWTEAMAGCPGSGNGGEGVASSLRPDTRRLFAPITGMDRLDAPVSFSRKESGAEVVPGKSLGIAPARVQSAALFTCNERLVDLDPRPAGELAWRDLTGW
ncbi:MAG: hypothetical protein JWP87_769 [Labilithrix sp.]|nr:hypothetical protein [Labilithrix sp.]